ncbi:MAG: nucleotidyltransferase family protein [Candidatus Heimdallarchaeota archaeon]
MTQDKNDILKMLNAELPHLNKTFHVKSIGVFGSWARGDQTEESDVDLLVDFVKPVGFFKFLELEDYLSEKLRLGVDLVTPDALKPLIKDHILGEALFA